MSRGSLEHRLNTRLVTGIAIYLVVFSAVLGLLLARGLVSDFDRKLISKAEGIVEIARQELATSEGGDDAVPVFDGVRLGYFAISLSDGTLIGPPDSLETLEIDVDDKLSNTPRFADLELPDGRPGRKVEIDFVPRRASSHQLLPSQVAIGSGIRTATLVVAESRQALNDQILRLSILMSAAWALLLASLALLVRSSLRRGLEPVIGLRRQVELLEPQGSVHRLSLKDPPEELAPVLDGINQLLRRRDETLRAQQAASSDMAQAS